MARDNKFKVDVSEPMDISKLTTEYKLAVLAGTGGFTLKAEEKDGLKKFVQGGGILLVNAAGGSPEFGASAEKQLTELFGPLEQLLPDSPILKLSGIAKGLEIDKVKYRRKTKLRIGTNRPTLRQIMVGGQPRVLYCSEDIIAGLVGYPSISCDGYEPESAYALMRNITVYSECGGKGSLPVTIKESSSAPSASPAASPAASPSAAGQPSSQTPAPKPADPRAGSAGPSEVGTRE